MPHYLEALAEKPGVFGGVRFEGFNLTLRCLSQHRTEFRPTSGEEYTTFKF